MNGSTIYSRTLRRGGLRLDHRCPKIRSTCRATTIAGANGNFRHAVRGCGRDGRRGHAALEQLERRELLCVSLCPRAAGRPPPPRTARPSSVVKRFRSSSRRRHHGQDYGTDGGVHNFLRYLETWGGQTLWYKGSIVALFYSQQGVGSVQVLQHRLRPADSRLQLRDGVSDSGLLPPRTPMFRDINTHRLHAAESVDGSIAVSTRTRFTPQHPSGSRSPREPLLFWGQRFLVNQGEAGRMRALKFVFAAAGCRWARTRGSQSLKSGSLRLAGVTSPSSGSA